jgi:type I restriction enzyme S subunit
MGSDGQKIRLEDFAVHQKGFAFKSKDYVEDGVAVVRVSNLTTSSIDVSDLKFVSEQVAVGKDNFRLSQNDVVIATVGSWPKNPASVVGKVIRVPEKCNDSLLNQNAVRFRARSNEYHDQIFLYYLLKSKEFSDYIISTAQGSANQASITLRDIYAFEFDCSSYEERKSVALILLKLDEKSYLK